MTSSPGSEDERVAKYFHDHAAAFDNIYRARERGIGGLRDRLSRGTVTERLRFVTDHAARTKPTRVLDVGCGSGRFGIELARQGADVVGLDFADDMIELATQLAAEAGVGPRCRFLQADFMTWSSEPRFDFGLAIGVTDYMRDPRPLIERLARVVEGEILVSFPRRWHPLVPLRYVRLRAANCPVYFYSQSDVEAIAKGALTQFQIRPFHRDYLLIGRHS
jgi:SAM-dependent methyltransferase